MKYEQIEEKVYEIIFLVTELKITSSLMTFNEMGINSLEYIRILIYIEEEYGIVFSYEYYENFSDESLKVLIEFVYEQIK